MPYLYLKSWFKIGSFSFHKMSDWLVGWLIRVLLWWWLLFCSLCPENLTVFFHWNQGTVQLLIKVMCLGYVQLLIKVMCLGYVQTIGSAKNYSVLCFCRIALQTCFVFGLSFLVCWVFFLLWHERSSGLPCLRCEWFYFGGERKHETDYQIIWDVRFQVKFSKAER